MLRSVCVCVCVRVRVRVRVRACVRVCVITKGPKRTGREQNSGPVRLCQSNCSMSRHGFKDSNIVV